MDKFYFKSIKIFHWGINTYTFIIVDYICVAIVHMGWYTSDIGWGR